MIDHIFLFRQYAREFPDIAPKELGEIVQQELGFDKQFNEGVCELGLIPNKNPKQFMHEIHMHKVERAKERVYNASVAVGKPKKIKGALLRGDHNQEIATKGKPFILGRITHALERSEHLRAQANAARNGGNQKY